MSLLLLELFDQAAARLLAERQRQDPYRAEVIQGLVGDFAQRGHVHEVRVPGVNQTLFVAPTVTEAERLVSLEGVSRGRIWTARELTDALDAHLGPGDFAAVALARLALDADIVAVRPRAS